MDQSERERLDELLWSLLQIGPATPPANVGLSAGQMGHEEVQKAPSQAGEGIEVVK